MNTDLHFSSQTSEWETPQDLFDRLHAIYGFELDVCATAENAKCPKFYTKLDDGLSQVWSGVCWMNPPYGREVGHWVDKACRSAVQGATVVCLLPARTDTKWFHNIIMKYAANIWFIKGRLNFGAHKDPAPFPSMLVVFQGVRDGCPVVRSYEQTS